MKTLQENRINYYRSKFVKEGTPVRFMFNGVSWNVVTGENSGKGSNKMYQIYYWNFDRKTARELADETETKAVFN